ncbi:carbohydrate-binding protein [Paenibacillus anaericanus]|uniref:Carbohydrate-binding protein n=1 Tax=Paenibacillus anaericanus TaxID=170367 RepID=A0A433Y7F0_9BACL|nr:carbohydrate-binding protein [Paenibacillus anaericanus]RUT45347.1 carbohydrate-binding protein [Paenibacillus anaericanus]
MRNKFVVCSLAVAIILSAFFSSIGSNIKVSAAGGPNLAVGKNVTASGYSDVYVANNVKDQNQGTYWESTNNAFPQWIQVHLGNSETIDQVVLKLPTNWETRTQTLSIQGSTNGTDFSTIVDTAEYTFNQTLGNTVTINFPSTHTQILRVLFTANTGWAAAQLSELEIYGTTAAPTAKPIPGQIEAENWDAMNGVQTQQTSDVGGGLNVGWIDVGDWLDYYVNVAETGTYTVEYRVASSGNTGELQLRSGQTTLATTSVPNTGAWQTWQTVTAEVPLSAGLQTLQVYASGNGFNFNWINFNKSNGADIEPPTAPSNLAYAQPTTGTILLTWNAATDNVGVQSYEIYANDQLKGTLNGTTLTFTDSQSPSASVTYYVIAKDVAGNSSTRSNTVTRVGEVVVGGTNLALNKPITASSTVHTFVAINANDDNTNTYWEGASNAYPNNLTVSLGANASINSIVLKLNPSSSWGTRTQNIQVLGREQSTSSFVNLVPATSYTFNPATGNTVTIPLTASAAEVRLVFTSNSGSSAGQIAEFQIFGTPAPNPDLTFSGLTWAPVSPNETAPITLSATVGNMGTAPSPATAVNFYLNNVLAGTTTVGQLAQGASENVSVNIGAKIAASYTVSAKVDENNGIMELDKTNNSYTHPTPLIVSEVPSADLVPLAIWSPGNPSAGDTVTYTVNLKNQGNIATTSGTHNVTLALKNSQGNTVLSLNGTLNGAIPAGGSANVTMGTWTAANGSYTVTATVTPDDNEILAKQENNINTNRVYIGRGANMPFTIIEAESTSNQTNGTILAPNFKPGDYAGEASGRSAVYLDSTGEYVEYTLTSPANAFVLRSSVAENTSGTVSIYANGVKKGAFKVTSKFSHVYATPSTLGRLGYDNQAGAGLTAYWLYEDSQLLLDEVFPAGTKIKIQKDNGDVPWIYLDMLETENVAAPPSNPDPSKYVEVSATKSIEQALNEFRQDSTKKGIFIPAGEWTLSNKIFLYGRATEIIGAGPWHTKLVAPTNQTNTDIGFNISSTADGSTIRDLSAWGNYIYRTDGPGKFIDGNGMKNVTVQNIWVEHFICLYWGVNSSNNTFKNNRIKNTFADGINMTNGSSYNVIDNNYSRGAGDDAFALFSAIDAGGSYNVGNKYTNLTATNVRRAAAFAAYGGSDNLFQNLYAADTLTYPGITISSLSFGYNTLGFGDKDTVFDGVTLDRTGGDFWTSVGADDKINEYQNFGAIWFFGGDRALKNILVKNIDINNSVYYGLMFQTKSPENLPMQNIRIENVNINNPSRYGIKLVASAEQGQGPVVGQASFTNVKVNNPGVRAIYGEDKSPNFTVIRDSGNNW